MSFSEVWEIMFVLKDGTTEGTMCLRLGQLYVCVWTESMTTLVSLRLHNLDYENMPSDILCRSVCVPLRHGQEARARASVAA